MESILPISSSVMVKKALISLLNEFPDLEAVYLFGSLAKGQPRPESDMDLALLLPPDQAIGAGSLVLSDLQLRMEKQLGVSVDLVNLRLGSTVFQNEIVNTGQRLYCRDVPLCIAYEALVLSMYQSLNVERAAILESFKRSGRAFAV